MKLSDKLRETYNNYCKEEEENFPPAVKGIFLLGEE
jgi:hypothetical protein